MASKKSRPLDDPPAASSSEEIETEEEEEEEEEEQEEVVPKLQSKETEEEDEEESDEEDEEESDDEDQDKKKKTVSLKSSPAKIKKNPPPESESESDSEKSPRASDFTIKPVTAVADDEEKTETPVSKPSAVKRRAENGKSASKPKKAKTEAVAGGEEDEEDGAGTTAEKKLAINRLWSEDDEIRVLKGLLEFQSKGKDVSTHNQEFHDFLKASLHVDVTKSQLTDKVRRLKRKFKTNLDRSTNGEDPSFSKAHDLKSFQLCKKIWGGGDKNGGIDNSNANEKPSRNSKKISTEKLKAVASIEAPKTATKENDKDLVKGKSEKVEVKDEKDDLGKLYPSLISSCKPDHISNLPIPEFVKNNLSLIGSSELKDLDSKWKKQNAAELEVYLARIDLLREETKMVLNAMKSNKN